MRHKPKKSLGQNFLVDNNIRRKIVAALDLSPADTVIEIGPGRGELTALIAPRVKRLTAVELDRSLMPVLQQACSGYENVEIVHADFLKYDLKSVPGKSRLKIIGNIPYYISTPIIEKVIDNRSVVSEVYLTVQREFAARLAGHPGNKIYGSLSCFVQYYAVAEMLFAISASCFYPAPKVDSAFIRLRMKDKLLLEPADEKVMFKIIRAAFGQRRKTLRRSLEGIVSKDAIYSFLSGRGLDLNIRPEDLDISDFAALTRVLSLS